SFVQEALDLAGPSVTVSTACSSSAKVFATAERMLRLGLVDAAVVGGVDTLCGSVLFGFNALQLVSAEPCRPFDAQRSGISIGEAVASLLGIEHGLRPGTVNTRVLDPAYGPQVRIETAHAPVRIALSNSFGFGSNNCVLVYGDAGAGGSR